MAGVERRTIAELSPEISNCLIVGIIISKTDANIYLSKKSSEFRGVIVFTIRDSAKNFVNCKFWGSKEKVEEYNSRYHLHDVIDVICPKVVPLLGTGTESIFQPTTSVPYVLVLNEGIGFFERHVGDTTLCRYMNNLVHIPTRALSSTLRLADVTCNGLDGHGRCVDLLVIVRTIRPVREVRTKTGSLLKCLELVVLDKSQPSGVILTIWNNEWIQRAENYWQPFQTVLHLVDVRVGQSTFYNSTVLGLSAKSIICENPNERECGDLKRFVKETPLSELDLFAHGYNMPSADSITTFMTVRQIYDRAEGRLKDEAEQFTVVLLVTITKFDLDGGSYFIGRKCKSCKRRIFSTQSTCSNEQCQMEFSFDHSGVQFDFFYDLNVHLTDHSGTLIESRLSNHIAQAILEIPVDEFMKLEEDVKSTIKWKFLLEKFQVKLVVKKKSLVRKFLVAIIVAMNKVEIEQVADAILVY